MQESTPYVQLLAELLSQSPEVGARLKQRLVALSSQRGLEPFNHSTLGYRTFKEFLQNGTDGLVIVESPVGPGDLRVSLNESYRSLYHPPNATGEEQLPQSQQGLIVRNAVWQAFCNPDTNRRRFLHVGSGAVRHFTMQEGMPRDIEEHPGEFLEITPISSEEQLAWMRNFAKHEDLPEATREALEEILVGPYTSGMNKAFTQALGEYSKEWRQERTARIEEIIRRWAAEQKFPVHKLYMPLTGTIAQSVDRTTVVSPAAASKGTREKALKLLEVLSDEDIARLVIPAILDAILTTTRH